MTILYPEKSQLYQTEKVLKENYGGKSFHLYDLDREGFLIPDSLLLSSDEVARISKGEMPSELLMKELSEFIQSRKSYFVVRSSANLEDGAEFSFAGLFESYLKLKSWDEIFEAIKCCHNSLNSKRVREYCFQQKINHHELRMGVVIQEMISPEWAGVTFTVNPLEGTETVMCLEFKEGLGDELMDGRVNPERVFYDWSLGPLTGNFPLPLDECARLSLEIQIKKGQPQDIEWAYKNGRFYFLQSRPISAILFKVTESWTNANMKDGGVASLPANPCVYSMYEYMINITMPTYFKNLGLLDKSFSGNWVGQFAQHIYWNLGFAKKALLNLPGFIEREFDEGLGITPNYDGSGRMTALNYKNIIRALCILWKIKKSINQRPMLAHKIIQKCEDIFNLTDQDKVKKLSDQEFYQICSSLIEDHWFSIEGGYFYHIYDNSNCRTLFLKDLERHNKKHAEISYLSLMDELDPLPHLAPLKKLQDIIKSLNSSEVSFLRNLTLTEFKNFYQEKKEFPGSGLIYTFIYENRFHSTREIDLLTPRWEVDPSQVFFSLKNLLEANTSLNKSFTPSPSNLKLRDKKLYEKFLQHKKMLNLREELRICSVKTFYVVQTYWIEMARRLKEKNLLEDLNDIFFLTYPEAINSFKEQKVPRNLIAFRKMKFKSFENYKKPNEIYSDLQSVQPPSQKTDQLRGVPCSRGIVEGKVFCAKSFEEEISAPVGFILVTEFIDPSWALSFINFTGVITETGGILSHGAAICREYKIPCVLSVPQALKSLSTGDRIRLDGASGEITKLDDLVFKST